MLNILVTGSSGYVGSTFINTYSSDYSISRFSLQSQTLKDISFRGVDVLLHCASIVHKGQKISSSEYDRVNVEYPADLANLAKNNGVKHFVFISSVAVYGTMKYINEHSVCRPCTKYGQSKFQAEKRLLELNDDEFKVSILRVPMIYGPLAPGNIQSVIKLVTYLPIIPLGNINNRRSFISIQNLIYSIEKVIEHRKGGVFLLADDEPISTTNLLKILILVSKKKRLLLNGDFVRIFVRFLVPSIHEKLWGDFVINSLQSKISLGLEFPIDVSDGLAGIYDIKRKNINLS
jgi:nucleoside-diphosphate-sugar epimerase